MLGRSLVFLLSAALFSCSDQNMANRAPIFSMSEVLNVKENNIFVAPIVVTDPDNDSIELSIFGPNVASFEIRDFGLYFLESPDYEVQTEYEIGVRASDGSQASELLLSIIVENINDNSPTIFGETEFFVPHHEQFVGSFDGTDPDGDTVMFSLSGANSDIFFIESDSGDLRFQQSPDFSAQKDFHITIHLSDGLNTASLDVMISQLLLPQASIDTYGEEVLDEPKIPGFLRLTQNNEVTSENYIAIEIRGSSSQGYPKKSFGFETRDAEDEDISVSLLGLPSEEDWILYGPFVDRSFVRNAFIYDLSNAMGMYASRIRYVELILNGEKRGLYLLMEKLKRDKNRINIKKNKTEDVSGGYILKIDKPTGDGGYYNDENSFQSEYLSEESGKEIHFLYSYPKSDDISVDQKEYIYRYINDFETALMSSDFDGPQGYRAYIDVPSFIDFFLLNELAQNIDAYRISTFLHKDRGGMLKMGPIWDFNLGFVNDGYPCVPPNEWAFKYNEFCPNDPNQVPFWWKRLLQDPIFIKLVQERWQELRQGVLSGEAVSEKLASYEQMLYDNNAVLRNDSVWDVNHPLINEADPEAASRRLSAWIEMRLSWMDLNIGEL